MKKQFSQGKNYGTVIAKFKYFYTIEIKSELPINVEYQQSSEFFSSYDDKTFLHLHRSDAYNLKKKRKRKQSTTKKYYASLV